MDSNKIKIIHVVGARPNFMKISPIMREMSKHSDKITQVLVHTGQHYDDNMSQQFFDDLNIPKPDIYLGVGSGTHSEQTAKIMIEFERAVLKEKPDFVLVVGDVNSTVACSLCAVKLHIPVIHVEAGLRSFDRGMPEEINRLVTDSISDHLFVSEESGIENLKKEGVSPEKVYFVGNVMIDTLVANMDRIQGSDILARTGNLESETYTVLTLHRPKNVDAKETLMELYEILNDVAQKIKIVYPVHPRAERNMEENGFLQKFEAIENLLMIDPLGYLDFMKLVSGSKFVLTDSGGIQEETTYLGIPCLTLRENTERPVTVTKGTNIIVGRDKNKIVDESIKVLEGNGKTGEIPDLWDGLAAERIVKVLMEGR